MALLAIDPGNNFIQIVAVLDGGNKRIVPLVDPRHPEGFLSHIAWNGERYVTGYELANNHKLRSTSEGLLKNRLTEQITLKKFGGKEQKTIGGREAFRFVVKEAVLQAVRILWEVYHEECTGVALAYPASWLSNRRINLIRTLEGMKINDKLTLHVNGTISEPAAGGLSYVDDMTKKFNVLVIDVGAGTTDVSIVRAIPQGQKTSNGKTVYYEIVGVSGLPDIAGSNCTQVMAELLRKKIGEVGANVSRFPAFMINEEAEQGKIALTTGMTAEPAFIGQDGMILDISVSREEYEKALEPLVTKIVKCATDLRSMHADVKLDAVVLTGGGSQIPLLQRRVREAFPDIPKDRIGTHDPVMAIARGAATYATDEGGVLQRTTYALGIEYYKKDSNDRIIEIFIPAGTELPLARTNTVYSTTKFDGTFTSASIMEANTLTPDVNKTRSDFEEIVSVRYDFHHSVPAGTLMEEYMSVDKNNVLHYFINDPSDKQRKAQEATMQLLHVGEGG